MSYRGNFPNGFTAVPVVFTSHDANGGATAPSAAFTTADVNIYKDGSATQKTTTNGLTMTSPFDSITGLHCLLIDTSNNTGDTGFWAAGHFYSVILTPATTTVAGQTIVKEIGSFTLDVAGAVNVTQWNGGAVPATSATGVPKVDVAYLLGTAWLTPGTAGTPDVNVKLWNALTTVDLPLAPTTAGRKLDVSTGGEAGLDWANIGSPTTVVGLTGTTIAAVTLANAQGIKKNTALAKFMFTMYDTSGNPKTGLQASLRTAGNSQRDIDGAGFADLTNISTITEIANGWYYVDFAAADLNGTNIGVSFAATGARTLNFMIHTVLV